MAQMLTIGAFSQGRGLSVGSGKGNGGKGPRLTVYTGAESNVAALKSQASNIFFVQSSFVRHIP
jgi:hypothetical protein